MRPTRPAPISPILAGLLSAGLVVCAALFAGAGHPSVTPPQDIHAYHLKEIEIQISERLDEARVSPATLSTPAPETALASGPVIALVIDDLGPDARLTARALALPATINAAILPYAVDAREVAGRALERGHEVMIHLPMEPGGLDDPGPNALTRHMDAASLQARVRWAIARTPGATGLNNHMGSAMTRDPRAMRDALIPAAEEGLFFLDSLTAPSSRAGAVAEGLGMTAFRRDVFLDHEGASDTIERRIAETEALAMTRGYAVAIGHPRRATLEALERWIPEAEARGIRFVRFSDMQTRPAVLASNEAGGVLGGAE